MPSVNMCIRIDSELKAKAEDILSQLGMNMSGTINMFLNQIVRERSVPLSLSLASPADAGKELLYAEEERKRGFSGYDARAVVNEMDEIIAVAEKSPDYGKTQNPPGK